MKTLIIAAATGAALLMGASSGFASTAPALTIDNVAGYTQLAADSNNDRFRCLEAQNSTDAQINPNLSYCVS
ncbi:hypothetical protein [Bauldia litoralis]|uniref:Secreted protein n=1 Tax=Bauldia litoralis TaxID=665467 RepID=A0A1G6AJK8_9HYPH|nr:hypothetical protein [Bauldia litoralis]SDB08283.1 hypothetical protein SAMN02982931_00697 [Bauldia litoralis]